MADADFGEMFHNFFMDEAIRKYAGVDTSKLKRHQTFDSGAPVRWSRSFMGMKSSPYNAVRDYYWREDFAKGNPNQEGIPMGYNRRVRMNLDRKSVV